MTLIRLYCLCTTLLFIYSLIFQKRNAASDLKSVSCFVDSFLLPPTPTYHITNIPLLITRPHSYSRCHLISPGLFKQSLKSCPCFYASVPFPFNMLQLHSSILSRNWSTLSWLVLQRIGIALKIMFPLKAQMLLYYLTCIYLHYLTWPLSDNCTLLCSNYGINSISYTLFLLPINLSLCSLFTWLTHTYFQAYYMKLAKLKLPCVHMLGESCSTFHNILFSCRTTCVWLTGW